MNIPPTWDYLPGYAGPATPSSSTAPTSGAAAAWGALSEGERIGLLMIGAWVVLELL